MLEHTCEELHETAPFFESRSHLKPMDNMDNMDKPPYEHN